MSSYTVQLNLTADQLKQYYAGQVKYVWARDVRGVSVQFPLTALRPFVTHNGVSGLFKIRVSGENRLLGIDQV